MTYPGKLTITRYTLDPVERGPGIYVYPLRLEASGENFPSEVFVYRRNTGLGGLDGDLFYSVASAIELEELPRSVRQAEDDSPFYRTSSCTLFCYSHEEAESIWQDIRGDANLLVKNYFAYLSLKAVDRLEITEDSIEIKPIEDMNQYMLTLQALPAGDATVDASDHQTITSPDPNSPGWLPVTETPSGFKDPVPQGARFFYNIATDSSLAERFPLDLAYNKHPLFINGTKADYGTIYMVTRDTIYWMSFDPGTFPDLGPGNAPWSLDYIDINNPGANPPSISMLVFEKN